MCFSLYSPFGFLLWIHDTMEIQLICPWGQLLQAKKIKTDCKGDEIGYTLLKTVKYTSMRMENITLTTCNSLYVACPIEIDIFFLTQIRCLKSKQIMTTKSTLVFPGFNFTSVLFSRTWNIRMKISITSVVRASKFEPACPTFPPFLFHSLLPPKCSQQKPFP